MIASFTHNLVFIKTRKTAGTSVEIALSSICAGDDICTTISAEDEILRRDYGSQPQNFCNDPRISDKYIRHISSGDTAAITKMRRSGEMPSPFYNHMPASEVAKHLPVLWKSAFKFTVERHPYERVVSLAWWRTKGRTPDISAAIDSSITEEILPNYPLYMEGTELLVDRIFEHTNLQSQIDALMQHLGLRPRQLPRAKSRYRADHRPAREVLSAIQKARIYEITAPEFEIMGYQR